MKHIIFILLLHFFVCVKTFSQGIKVSNPYYHFCKNFPLVVIKDTFNYNFKRILYDFNKDGLMDIALSDLATEGKAGNEWYIYYRKKSNFYYLPIKRFFADWAFYTKKTNYVVLFISYIHLDANSGSMNYDKLINNKFFSLKSILIKDITAINKKISNEFNSFNIKADKWSPKCKTSRLNNCYPKL